MGADGSGDASGDDRKLTGIKEARRRIAEAARTGATVLNLGDLDLTEVPDEITALTDLTSLDLRENQIGAKGARAVATLTGLTSLDLMGNQIGAEGARAIATLTGLTSLDLMDNQIGVEGARAIAALTCLASLDLRNNQLGDEGVRAIAVLTGLTNLNLIENDIGPNGAQIIATLPVLTTLNLGDNRLGGDGADALTAAKCLESLLLWDNKIGDAGAKAISRTHTLKSLNLKRNEIGSDGARAIADLTGLISLDLDGNQVGDDGARALVRLTNLASLNLTDNQIGDDGVRVLLDAWAGEGMSQLDHLSIVGNEIDNLGVPAETIQSGDAQAIFAVYRAFRQAKQQGRLKPLNEAKMLVVGNEAVGKTSLIRYLVHGQPRDPDEKKTPGTAIHEKIEIQDWSPDAADIKLNVWDFGGQEIMHGTHRYFLTRRSLYLLVLEDRREDDRAIHNWLKIIRNRGGDAPIIVVINKSDEGKEALRLDEHGLRREHPEIAGILRTSCDAGKWAQDSIEALRKAIADCLAKHDALKQVRDAVPESWLWVKQQIAERARQAHVLQISAFERLCLEAADKFPDAESLRDEATQRALLRLLHDLGVLIAHGLSADDLSVSPTVALLDPNWLTGAIYTVLNHRELERQNGIFKREQLNSWLDPQTYPAARHKFILDMMQDDDIGLAFELPDTNGERFLVPEGLPKDSPEYSMWPKDSLRFRFRYEFLPRGLIPRFIVAAHRNLTEKQELWRTGGVFQYGGSCVLVEGDVDKRVINIAVTNDGANRRAALHVMLNYFDQVHRLNPEAMPEAFVPMPDNPEIEESYTHLLSLEKLQGPDYQHYPRNSLQCYRVGDLLEGVGWREFGVEGHQVPGMKISGGAGDVNVTVVNGGVRGRDHTIGRQQTLRVQQGAAPAERPDAPKWWHWPVIALGCAVLGVVALIAVDVVPPEWQRYVIVFEAVAGITFLLNPALFYRRMMAYALSSGLLGGALSGVLNIKIGDASLSWEGGPSAIFYLAMLAVITYFIWADQKAGRA